MSAPHPKKSRIKQPPDQYAAFFRVEILRYRAQQCRCIAQDLLDPELQNILMQIAEDYEILAQRIAGATNSLH